MLLLREYIGPSVRPSVYLSVCLSVWLAGWPSLCVCGMVWCVCLCRVRLSVDPFARFSLRLSVSLSARLSVCLSVCLPV